MCGISGFWDPGRRAGEVESNQIASRMANALYHRGPDDEGIWVDAPAGLALGHRRLAIQDLSQEGHQPMQSADGNYVLVFNGEIYNFQLLRQELEERGHAFRGHSDTEVLLAAICEWGLKESLGRVTGMFALALWERQTHTLRLARDRAGEKPLYFGWLEGVFAFGSELKALQMHPRWQGAIDRRSVALLTRYGYVPAPFSVFQNINKLQPGCVLSLTEAQLESHTTPSPEPYWTLESVAEAGVIKPFQGTETEAVEELRKLLLRSVAQQMVADVPLGAFLSGGIDSSLVVALMQEQSTKPIKSFTIGFEQGDFDEAPFARAVARHLGTDHTELYVAPGELRQVISKLPVIYDEPFADASQIPTVLLCELTRSHVTVSLSGDAGDELFGGYAAYRQAQSMWRIMRRIPESVRLQMARGFDTLASLGLNSRMSPMQPLCERLANLSVLFPAQSDRVLYQGLMSPNRNPLPWLKHKEEPVTRFDEAAKWQSLPELLHRMMFLDFVTYLPDDILVKVDRAAMSVSLETRIPLLDHRIIEFAWSLPTSFQQRHGLGKWLLRQVLHQYVPASLVERAKKGFGVPIAEWLRGPLKSWAEALLSGARLRQEGFFDPETVQRNWLEHLSGRRDWGTPLWHILIFQAWLEQQTRRQPVPEENMSVAC